MQKKESNKSHSRLLVLVDESNVGSSVLTAGRGLDWLKLRGQWGWVRKIQDAFISQMQRRSRLLQNAESNLTEPNLTNPTQ
jgi:hypothetical protein